MPSILFLIRKQSVMLDEGWNVSNWRTGVKYGDKRLPVFFYTVFFFICVTTHKTFKKSSLTSRGFSKCFLYVCVHSSLIFSV